MAGHAASRKVKGALLGGCSRLSYSATELWLAAT